MSNQDAPYSPEAEFPPANLTAFGKAVRDARREHGLTSEALARRAGMSRRMLTEIEAGRSSATLSKLHAISHALSIAPTKLVEYLCEGHDDGSTCCDHSHG
ncbi:helix-turn-helix domain-containing protein [Actinoplanes sp. NPDC020271]|uniref:helix-turn-helix domain-containing protein n=1 Tax=Actinoplanes sp. NPDC020271 TaxID=3363896 RepID=UPI003792AD67